MTGIFDTVIVHGGDEIENTAKQTQVSNDREPSPSLEHVESLSMNDTGGQSAVLLYVPYYFCLYI